MDLAPNTGDWRAANVDVLIGSLQLRELNARVATAEMTASESGINLCTARGMGVRGSGDELRPGQRPPRGGGPVAGRITRSAAFSPDARQPPAA